MTDGRLSPDEIAAALQFNDGTYQREMVDAAIARRDEMIPRLIDILKQARNRPDDFTEDEDRFDHIYALMLLGHLRSTDAHDVIIDLFSRDEETLDMLFGDLTTSNLPTILSNTCGGSIDALCRMAANREVFDYARISALQAIAFAVAEQRVPREQAVAFMGTLFTGSEAEEGSDFWGLLAVVICELYPEEHMAIIEAAYEKGMIDPAIIGFKAFEDALLSGKAATLEELRRKSDDFSLDDIHAVMGGWACFEDGLELFAPTDPGDLFGSASYAMTDAKGDKRPDKKKK